MKLVSKHLLVIALCMGLFFVAVAIDVNKDGVDDTMCQQMPHPIGQPCGTESDQCSFRRCDSAGLCTIPNELLVTMRQAKSDVEYGLICIIVCLTLLLLAIAILLRTYAN